MTKTKLTRHSKVYKLYLEDLEAFRNYILRYGEIISVRDYEGSTLFNRKKIGAMRDYVVHIDNTECKVTMFNGEVVGASCNKL